VKKVDLHATYKGLTKVVGVRVRSLLSVE